ncbi:ABC transporter substrate-binding protein [Pseudomonas eucalypticola]|uniref:ABC transporter substrate-binding protein n=1 Tax=Pseudomonas eucalypticola TaxID=2599595 RepID=A0A7D5H790_9PSED|nr:ABC transporter substrate-binding protein [Pseudomonas eucalypticola]QKZ05803.1 ABC transporter substrate-binding protein [Pseudomonas eucalypticola]
MSAFKWLMALPLMASIGLAGAAQLTLQVAAPDLSAGPNPSGGPVVDVLHSRHMLEDAFAADGIRVQWHFFKGAGPLINEAMSNGQLDVAFLGDLASIIGRASGLQTRLVMATGRGINGYLGVVPGSGITRIQDLKGKRVGILRGTADHLALIDVLASAGLDERDIKLINLDFNAVNGALAARQIDASWAPARLFALKDRGLIEIPVGSQQLAGKGAGQGGLVVTQAFLDAHPEAAARLVGVVAQALDWLSQEQNRQAQIDLGVAQSAYPARVLRESLAGGDLGFIYSPLLDPLYVDTLRKDVRLSQAAHLIRAPIDVDQWIAPAVLDQGLAQAHLANAWKPATQYRWSTGQEPAP